MLAHPDKESPIWKLVDGNLDHVSGRTAFDAMRAGDPVGKKIVDEYIAYLGCGLANCVNTLQPDILCVGGGICNEGETLLAPVREYVDREQYGGAKSTYQNLQGTAGERCRNHRCSTVGEIIFFIWQIDILLRGIGYEHRTKKHLVQCRMGRRSTYIP